MANNAKTLVVTTTSAAFAVDMITRGKWMYLTNLDAANSVHVTLENAAAVPLADDVFTILAKTTLALPRTDTINAVSDTANVNLLVNGIN